MSDPPKSVIRKISWTNNPTPLTDPSTALSSSPPRSPTTVSCPLNASVRTDHTEVIHHLCIPNNHLSSPSISQRLSKRSPPLPFISTTDTTLRSTQRLPAKLSRHPIQVQPRTKVCIEHTTILSNCPISQHPLQDDWRVTLPPSP